MRDSRGAPGRPARFAPEQVVEEAMHLFWERGYESTSLDDLERRTGLSRSSLYNSFGPKRKLFDSAIGEYVRRAGSLLQPLETGSDGLAAVRCFFDALYRRLCAPRARPGCLMVNTLMEFGGTDALMSASGKSFFVAVHRALARALARAARLGEIDDVDRSARAHVLLAMAISMNVQARAGADRSDLARLRKAVDRELQSWHCRCVRGSAVPGW